VDVVGERLRVTHRRFLAEIDPAARRGRLYSPGRDGSGLQVILRLSLAARLPRQADCRSTPPASS
jgi:hypothetical protein